MSFVSIDYALLFSVVFLVYYAIQKIQIPLLLGASLVFYSWGHHPFLLAMLLVVSTVSSAATFLILRGRVDRKSVLICGIVFNLLILAFFKYKFLVFPNQAGSA